MIDPVDSPRRLTAGELHDALTKALPRDDPVPSLSVCVEHQEMTPFSYAAFTQRVLTPPTKVNRSVIALRGSLEDLKLFWVGVAIAGPESSAEDPIDRRALKAMADENPALFTGLMQRLPYIMDDIDKVEVALQSVKRWTRPWVLSPPIPKLSAAIRDLYAFFLATTATTKHDAPYGIAENGPAVRFVCACLAQLDWKYQSDRAVRKALQRYKPQGGQT